MKMFFCFLSLISVACFAAEAPHPFHGRIERFDPAFDRLVAPDAVLEELAGGFSWAEGPVWMGDAVVFSDVPRNTAYRWSEGMQKAEVFLRPSGLFSPSPDSSREPGSNGLALDAQGRLLLCQHGARRIARYENGVFVPLADHYEGKRFNSPNDLALRRNGDTYFTDPPYGLDKLNDSAGKELPFNGVYRLSPDGAVTLLVKDLSFPNGIGFSPDEKVLYVGLTQPDFPHIMAYDVQADGTLANERLFFDARPLSKPDAPGSCDGLKIDRDGDVWSAGPGGILVITPAGKLIGRLNTGVATANCGWGGADGDTLYITAGSFLVRVKTMTQGAGRAVGGKGG